MTAYQQDIEMLGQYAYPPAPCSSHYITVVGRIIYYLKNVYILILRTCVYTTIPGKRDLADKINLRILKWETF